MEKLKLINIVVFIVILGVGCKSQYFEKSELKEELLQAINSKKIEIYNNNRFDKIPLECFEVTDIISFSFTGTECIYNEKCINIYSIPKDILKFKKLKSLKLVMNDIKEIPPYINLMKLTQLDLSDNRDINIDNLKNETIEVLNLNNCNLSYIPENIYKMKKLRVIGIEGNPNISQKDITILKKKFTNCEIYL